MITGRRHGSGIIIFTFLAALTLTVVPLPEWGRIVRPDWVGLVLIYWCLALPDRVGVTTGWFTGLLVDLLTGTLLGQHAMALAVVAWVTLKFHQRIRLFPVWQQALIILVLLVLHQLLSLWVTRFIGRPGPAWYYWTPSLFGALLWPPIYMILRSMRRGFSVN
ncbi:MAG: rod shape-determining protein MreD [Pseudomonadota bacterium]